MMYTMKSYAPCTIMTNLTSKHMQIQHTRPKESKGAWSNTNIRNRTQHTKTEEVANTATPKESNFRDEESISLKR